MPYNNTPKKMYDSPKKMDHGMKMMDTAKSTMAKMKGSTPYGMYKMKHGSPADMMRANYGSAMPNKHGEGEKKSSDVKVNLPEVEVVADKKPSKDDYLYEKREILAKQGKGYNVKDNDGNYVYVSSKKHRNYNIDANKDGVMSPEEKRNYSLISSGQKEGEKPNKLFVATSASREEANRRNES
tara:strand:+ start:417 stop:965 length:549 start_codon:yes stop_codon:yes gene_type:complete